MTDKTAVRSISEARAKITREYGGEVALIFVSFDFQKELLSDLQENYTIPPQLKPAMNGVVQFMGVPVTCIPWLTEDFVLLLDWQVKQWETNY